ncbi:MAG: hypothetical protein HOP08_03180 [Cyclobacteriaceae bacterium]|nr:hypothetical protein [Cyclobacteriaceae bacterium]
MKTLRSILAILFGIFLIIGGVNHFIKPEMYDPLIPDFFPKLMVNYITGAIEVILGIGAIIPAYRSRAGMGILILMVIFLPIHIWDVFRDNPAMGSQGKAILRVPFQFLFILWAWFISKK